MSDAGNWCLIESDPGVFTELIQKFGVKGVQVEEIWSLDEDSFNKIKPVHGLIFLFKWQADEKKSGLVVSDSRLDNIFFAKQLIYNSCATQAIISILLNTRHPDVELGSTLTEFKDFARNFDASMKGLALSNSDTIRNVHNSFARQTLFEFDEKSSPKNDDVYHFIGYIPIEDRLYELDGLQEGPIDLGAIPKSGDWLTVARPVIQERIHRYSEGEIHFNLMALVSDRKMVMQRRIDEIIKEMESKKGSSPSLSEELSVVQLQLSEEENKRSRWRVENIRRKHNYIPLIINMLKILADEGKLLPIYQAAVEKSKHRAKAQNQKV